MAGVFGRYGIVRCDRATIGASVQRSERLDVEGHELAVPAVADLRCPGGIGEQGTPGRYEIGLAAFQ